MDSKEALRKLIAEAGTGELVFSTDAHIALRVRLALDDPEIHLDKAARIVQAEPLLAAKIVALANSVAFNRSGNSISDIRSAVSRLGLELIRGLSTGLIIRQISTTPSPAQQALVSRLWEHSAHVAALCYVLARRVSRQNPDAAMFAGLVHEIGNFYLISRTAAYPGLIEHGLDEIRASGGEAQLGEAVLRALAVPDAIAHAVRAQWQGDITLPPKNLADTLFLANCLTPILNPLHTAPSTADRAELLALAAQAMANETLGAVLEESADELNTITTALQL